MAEGKGLKGNRKASALATNQVSAPTISLHKGGGAILSIGEKFAANPVTDSGSLAVSIDTSSGRSEFGPQLSLSSNSGGGNRAFGFSWTLSLPSITRRTENLPKYQITDEFDVCSLSRAEDLVPEFEKDAAEAITSHVSGCSLSRAQLDERAQDAVRGRRGLSGVCTGVGASVCASLHATPGGSRHAQPLASRRLVTEGWRHVTVHVERLTPDFISKWSNPLELGDHWHGMAARMARRQEDRTREGLASISINAPSKRFCHSGRQPQSGGTEDRQPSGA